MVDFESSKDKIVGRLKEVTGKLTDNPELEFKGKVESIKGEVGEKIHDVKQDVIEKANDMMDKMKSKKQKDIK